MRPAPALLGNLATMARIELASTGLEAVVLPLNYIVIYILVPSEGIEPSCVGLEDLAW